MQTLELVSRILDPNPGSGTPLTRSSSEHDHGYTTIPMCTRKGEESPGDPTNLPKIARGDAGEVEPCGRRGDGEQDGERRGAPEHRRRPHRRGGGGVTARGIGLPRSARRGGGWVMACSSAWRARSGG
jgi:hypothetical protein